MKITIGNKQNGDIYGEWTLQVPEVKTFMPVTIEPMINGSELVIWTHGKADVLETMTESGKLVSISIKEAGKPARFGNCKYEDWDDTTNPRLCQCSKYEGVDCGNVPDDVSKCPDYEEAK